VGDPSILDPGSRGAKRPAIPGVPLDRSGGGAAPTGWWGRRRPDVLGWFPVRGVEIIGSAVGHWVLSMEAVGELP
jgi:hypothetical protein